MRFRKIEPIRPEILFNLKQMLRVQRVREEKMLNNEIKHEELIDYIKKRNEIGVILENTKKIKQLKAVADIIEQEVAQ